jgi:hypothetical protein
MENPAMPTSAFPAVLEGECERGAVNMTGCASPRHEGLGRIRLGARLDIRKPGQEAGDAYRRQSAWENPIGKQSITRREIPRPPLKTRFEALKRVALVG